MNQTGYEAGNAAICNGRTIPWLQETADEQVWEAWAVTYRDVVILDGNNVVVGVYNLTEHDLSDPANRDALKKKLRNAGGS